MNQRQSDQPTGAQPGHRSQYQPPPAGGPGTSNVQGAPGGGQAPTGQQGGATGQATTGSQGQARLFPTRNYLDEDVRAPVIERLNRLLADTTVLLTHAKFAHWNVKGVEFYALHQLFDEVAESFEEHADMIGERITALGGQAMGTAGMAVANCSLPSMPTDAVTGPEYVKILADRLAIHDANLYGAIEEAQSYGDADTADLLNELSREVSQHLWFLEAHLQTQPVGTVPTAGSSTRQGSQPGGMAPQGRAGSKASSPPTGGGQQPGPGATPTQQPTTGQSTSSGAETRGADQPGGPSYQRSPQG